MANGDRWVPDSENWSGEQIDRYLDIRQGELDLARDKFEVSKNERDDRAEEYAKLEQAKVELAQYRAETRRMEIEQRGRE